MNELLQDRVRRLASMVWAFGLNRMMEVEGKTMRFSPEDFEGQRLINKDIYFDFALQIIKELGYLSPEQVEDRVREERERIIGEIERERFGEPQYIPQSGREPVIICLTETDLQALKGETNK